MKAAQHSLNFYHGRIKPPTEEEETDEKKIIETNENTRLTFADFC